MDEWGTVVSKPENEPTPPKVPSKFVALPPKLGPKQEKPKTGRKKTGGSRKGGERMTDVLMERAGRGPTILVGKAQENAGLKLVNAGMAVMTPKYHPITGALMHYELSLK